MRRVKSQIIILGLLANSTLLAADCQNLGHRQIVLLEEGESFASGLYDPSSEELSTVEHNVDALERAPFLSCFDLRNQFGDLLRKNVKFVAKVPLPLPLPRKRKFEGPFLCAGFARAEVALTAFRQSLRDDIVKRIRTLQTIHSSPSGRQSYEHAVDTLFIGYDASRPDSDDSQSIRSSLLQSPESTMERLLTASSILESQSLRLDEFHAALFSRSSRLYSQGEDIFVDCDGWYGSSGSIVLDRNACIVGYQDQLDPLVAVHLRPITSLGFLKIVATPKVGKVVPCDS